jgi:SAM-dependent methyltransferase
LSCAGDRSRGGAEPWYEQAFRADYRLVYPHRDLAAARREAAFLAKRGVRGRVLDLGCGFGRHALALAELGCEVVGLDLSRELLLVARELPGYERFLQGRLVRGRAERAPFRAGAFDSVVVLFSSFGYLGEEGDRRVMDEIARLTRPGGLAVLDLMNPDHVRSHLVAESARRGPGFELCERRALIEEGRRVVKEVELQLDGGAVRRWREDVRLYSLDEIARLFRASGLFLEGADGEFDGRGISAESPRLIARARRE